MKFGRKLFLALLLLVCLLGALPVLAAEQEVYPAEQVWDVNPMYADIFDPQTQIDIFNVPATMADAEYGTKEDAVDVIREQMLARNGSFHVYVQLPYDANLDRSAIWTEMLYAAMEHTGVPNAGDYLYSHYNGAGGNISTSTDYTYFYITYTYTIAYKTTAAQEATVDSMVAKVLASLELDSKTKYGKICAIYDYLTENVDYDYEDLENDADLLKYSTYGALIEKTCVCQGYSSTFYRLCLEAGIDARMIRGEADNGQSIGGHAWNIVELDGLYFYLDATWDEPRADKGMEYDYFLVASAEFETDHFSDPEYQTDDFKAAYPISEVTYVAPAITASGTCGGNVYWQLDEYGLLTIFGNGTAKRFSGSVWDKNAVKAILFEDGITGINDYTFSDHANLTMLILGNTVTSIGREAFQNCTALESVEISDSVKTIGLYAFWGCSDLRVVTVGSGVTQIKDRAFYGCEQITVYVKDPSAWCKIGFEGSNSNPAECANEVIVINDQGEEVQEITLDATVTKIPQNAFYNSRFAKVTVGDNVTEIGSYAFFACDELTSVTLGDGVKTIGANAFCECNGLTDVVFGNSLTDLENYAFQYCSSLKSVALPNTVTRIGSQAFFECSSLENVTLSNTLTEIGQNAFWGCSSLKYIEIPGSVTNIAGCAFYECTGLESVVIRDGVTGIGSNAFNNCSSLNSVELPGSLTSLGYGAFEGCSSLKTVKFSAGLTNIASRAFYACASLESVEIPDSVTNIGDQVFYGCSSLKSIEIPDSVTELGYGMFAGCSSLESMTLPFVGASVKTAEDTWQYPFGYIFGETSYEDSYAAYSWYHQSSTTSTDYDRFYIPTSLKSVTITGGNILYGAFEDCRYLTQIVLPDDLTAIGGEAFKDCTALTCVDVPDTVTEIGRNAFYGCKAMTSAPMPASLTTIGEYAFYDCAALTEVTIPDGVTEIGESAFYNCSALTSVQLPSGLSQISDCLFSGCTLLEGITLPANLETIGDYAFYNCIAFTEIVIPEKVTSIGQDAFAYCSGVPEITIPTGVTNIGDSAFYKCTGLKAVYISDLKAWCNIEFGTGEANPLYNAKALYLNGELISGEIVIPEGVTRIGNYAFYYCTGLTQVSMPDTVKTLGEAAFAHCDKLVSAKLPDNLETMGTEAFAYCHALTQIKIPDSVTTLGEDAFFNCVKLTDVTLSQNLQSIEAETFYNCGLIHVSIPASVKKIGNYAFDCDWLTSVIFEGDAPEITASAFSTYGMVGSNQLIGAFYPAGNETWTEDKRITYGNVPMVWHPYGEDGTIEASGTCGESLTWSYADGVLTIEGSGAMADYPLGAYNHAPWYYLRGYIEKVVLPNELTRIGEFAFYDCVVLKEVNLPAAVTLGCESFASCDRLETISIPKKAVLEEDVFYDCSALKYVKIAASATSFSSDNYSNWLKGCTLLETAGPIGSGCNIEFGWTTEIPDYAFWNNTSIKKLIVPETVTNWGWKAFGKRDADEVEREIIFEGDAPNFETYAWYNRTIKAYYPYNANGWDSAINKNYSAGSVSWNVYGYGEAQALQIVTLPNKLQYAVGENLDLTGLTAKLTHDSGYEKLLNADELTVQSVDMSVSGKKTVIISSGEFTATFDIHVHNMEAVQLDAATYPQSEHDYKENADETQTFSYPGAQNLQLTFSEQTFTEANIDFLYIYDGNGSEIAKYSGTQAAGKTLQIEGDTFTVRLVSDESDNGYGYAFSSIVANTVKHDAVIDPATATCTQSGLSEGSHCGVCGEVIVAQQQIPATGHSYAEGTCSGCGEADPDYVAPVEKFNLAGTAVTLGNSLTVNFAININLVEGTDNYAVITKSYVGSDDVTVTVPQSKWVAYAEGSPLYLIPFNGVAAKEMGDQLRITVYNAEGEAISNESIDSIKAYCYRQLAKTDGSVNAKLKTLLVDALNYGAAAQVAFTYDVNNLVNADLTDEQKGLATGEVMMQSSPTTGEGYVGATVTLKNEIILNFAINQAMADKAAYALATYTNHYGEAKSVKVEAASFVDYGSGIYLVPISGMSIADCRRNVECTMYDAAGEPLATYGDSVEGFVARNADKGEIYTAIIKFATSAYNFFH